jgi:hypothetical protein
MDEIADLIFDADIGLTECRAAGAVAARSRDHRYFPGEAHLK